MVVDSSARDNGDGLEAAVGMLGEARQAASAVIEGPAVGVAEIAALGVVVIGRIDSSVGAASWVLLQGGWSGGGAE